RARGQGRRTWSLAPGPWSLLTVDGVQHRRFQTAKAEIEPFFVEKRTRQTIRPRIPLRRGALDGWPSREAKSQDTGDIIKGLAGIVSQGGPEQLELQRRRAVKQGRVATADDQTDTGEDVLARGQATGVDMSLDVIAADKRYAQRQGKHLGGTDADK